MVAPKHCRLFMKISAISRNWARQRRGGRPSERYRRYCGRAILALRMRLVAYPLPISWGLMAVFVAERANHPSAAWVALVGACALAVIAGFIQVDDGVKPKRVAAPES